MLRASCIPFSASRFEFERADKTKMNFESLEENSVFGVFEPWTNASVSWGQSERE